MRAILLANATVATCVRLRDVRLTSHVLRPEDCLVFCSSTVCAPCTKSFRRYLFPRLLVPVSFCLPPVECSPGTTPSQAANPRPFLKAAPLPMAATVAVAVIGPIPGIATRRLHWFKFAADARDQLVGFLDLPVQVLHLQPQLGQKYAQCTGQLVVRRLPGYRVETPQYDGVLCGW